MDVLPGKDFEPYSRRRHRLGVISSRKKEGQNRIEFKSAWLFLVEGDTSQVTASQFFDDLQCVRNGAEIPITLCRSPITSFLASPWKKVPSTSYSSASSSRPQVDTDFNLKSVLVVCCSVLVLEDVECYIYLRERE